MRLVEARRHLFRVTDGGAALVGLALGLFYLSDIMGGGLVLIGNLIRDQLLKVRDWNVGSAMSMVLIAMSTLFYLLYRKSGGNNGLGV